MLIFCGVTYATAPIRTLGYDPMARDLRLPRRADTLPGLVEVRYPNKSLEILPETFSKMAPEKLPWTMLHQLGGKPP